MIQFNCTYNSYVKGVVHKWRHAIFDNFWTPSPIVTESFDPFPLRLWRQLWTTPYTVHIKFVMLVLVWNQYSNTKCLSNISDKMIFVLTWQNVVTLWVERVRVLTNTMKMRDVIYWRSPRKRTSLILLRSFKL